MPSGQGDHVAYSDKWLTLRTDGTLLIHKYYMFYPTRTLQISLIQSIAQISALNLSRWEFKDWGVGTTMIMWPMDWSRERFTLYGPSDQVRKRTLLIRTTKGIFRKIGVTCEDVGRFLDEVEKMGVNVLREADKGD